MPRSNARPLLWLAALLAVYLCAPFVASVPQLGAADWANVDWAATWSAVAVSAGSASVASLVILLGGVPLGYFLARSTSRKVALLGFVVQLPLALPPLTSGVLLLFLLGPYSWVGRVTGGALTDSFTGIVLAETFVAAPFLIIAAKSAFAAVDPVLDDVAATLGHRAGSRFFRVMLPVAWPAIRAGLALAWLRAFGEFGATVMVAYHPYSLPVYTYVVFGGQGLPAMMPLLLPTLAIAILCAVLSIYSLRQGTAREQTEHGDDALEPVPQPEAANREATADLRLAFHLRRRLGAFTLDLAWQPVTRRLAIIGPSGSGKSLALRLIAGLDSNASSTVQLGGKALHALPPERRQIGYMPQDYGLFPHMNVARQLSFPVDADAASARYWLDHLGLTQLVGRLPRQLSFGQRQRVALARALTRHSELLLFDEPFAALDTPRRRRLQQSLRALQREIAAVTIIVTHDPDEAALLADEVLVVEQGRVLQAGPIDAVFERPASMRVASLLGLHNVGEGTMTSTTRLQINSQLSIDIDAGVSANAEASVDSNGSGANLHAGEAVMWRVSSHAVTISADGAHHGVIEAVELRRGERYVRVNVAGVSFDLPGEDAAPSMTLREGAPCRIDIEASGVTAWRAADAA
ncbi:ATP-binding cassette domain-containing protein [Paraburkholderia sp. D15]|uniref:ABC transporter ATP-binding protein/permease n=1 Tax=Paraburkholderia sp. D15 TaxID=2880218 RepID=UPI00247AC947|nr:ATP-binding cassette domain-containing protein [Paraburkholderia sp. D15]WGS53068.1 ATP-binding cassette domain-containing protein [Paraburkholderia sp. D15]